MSVDMAVEGPATKSKASPSLAGWSVAREEVSPRLALEWDELSAEGVASPYQSRMWVMNFLKTAGKASAQEAAIMTVRDHAGSLLGLYPLTIKTEKMGRIACFVGEKHANYHMPLLKAAFAISLNAKSCHALMKDMAAALPGLDAFVFINQPRLWNDLVPPMITLAAWNSAQPAYALSLLPDADAAMERAMSTHARKGQRNKRRRLDELGKITLLKAEQPDQIEDVAQAFIAQKAARFADLRVEDPFAEDGIMDMLKLAAISADGHTAPAIAWHALLLNERIIATFIGAVDQNRYSGMATSFTSEEAPAKCSPGEALLVELIRDQAKQGRKIMDLGVGEARYKATFCDVRETMCESVLPVSAKGYLILARLQLKRMFKHAAQMFARRHPLAFKALRRIARP